MEAQNAAVFLYSKDFRANSNEIALTEVTDKTGGMREKAIFDQSTNSATPHIAVSLKICR